MVFSPQGRLLIFGHLVPLSRNLVERALKKKGIRLLTLRLGERPLLSFVFNSFLLGRMRFGKITCLWAWSQKRFLFNIHSRCAWRTRLENFINRFIVGGRTYLQVSLLFSFSLMKENKKAKLKTVNEIWREKDFDYYFSLHFLSLDEDFLSFG